ncbi:hypothetical protein PVAND_001329 [Polypedilum vanderplanki]|uniref:Uncharacterized protein n=1 Tax=Polypedilum vanderplanki TaxID=319348 RepID=A0A9J6BNX6_POLVA|nr:hypothetical protein PVAND_001329 [Polypedilum vanderplanki]
MTIARTRNVNSGSIFHTLKYREMVTNWNPWGKPGHGAPNNDIRIRNLENDGLYPVSNQSRNAFTLPKTNASQSKLKYYTPGVMSSSSAVTGGCGAPLVSESGKLLVPLREDPLITFNESTRNFVEKDLRYRKSQQEKTAYKQELDRIIEEKKRLKFNEKLNLGDGRGVGNYRNQNNLDPFADSWGKPGPGGTPWRDPKNVGQNFMKSMGWTTKDTLKSINNEINSPQQQLPAMQKPARCRAQPASCCERCSCECVKKIESTILRSPPQAQYGSKGRENEEPVVKKSPKSLPHYALPQQCNRQLEPLQQQQQSSKPTNIKQTVKKQSKTNLISGGVELVPLLAKRRDERQTPLSTTDITKYKINQSSRTDGDPEYLNDLERQVVHRKQLRQLSREREIESSRKHFINFDSFWGRPGAGAPMPNKNKLNLDNLLYNSPMYEIYPQQHQS